MANRTDINSKKNYNIRVLISILLVITGALTLSLTKDIKEGALIVVQQFGLALMVAGSVSLLRDILIEKWKNETNDPSYLRSRGIQMLSNVRQGDDRYHKWVITREPQALFFGGRSVLHRVKIDFEDRKLPAVEDIFIRKIDEGSIIKILLCDPLWDQVPNIAKAENQGTKKIYHDLNASIEIINSLRNKLNNTNEKHLGEIDIRCYNEQFQYAFHWTRNLNTDDYEMLIGMYFAQKEGCRSPLFEVFDKSIQKEFEDHFENIFSRSKQIFFYGSKGRINNFDNEFYHQFKELYSRKT